MNCLFLRKPIPTRVHGCKSKSKLKHRIIIVEKQEKQIATLCQTAGFIAIIASISYEKLAANVEAKQKV